MFEEKEEEGEEREGKGGGGRTVSDGRVDRHSVLEVFGLDPSWVLPVFGVRLVRLFPSDGERNFCQHG